MFKFRKKNCVIGSILIYIALIVLLILLQDRQTVITRCYDEPCVRFCCKDEEFCNEKFIRKNFNLSVLDNSIDTMDYKILFGKPICNLNKDPANDFHIFSRSAHVRYSRYISQITVANFYLCRLV